MHVHRVAIHPLISKLKKDRMLPSTRIEEVDAGTMLLAPFQNGLPCSQSFSALLFLLEHQLVLLHVLARTAMPRATRRTVLKWDSRHHPTSGLLCKLLRTQGEHDLLLNLMQVQVHSEWMMLIRRPWIEARMVGGPVDTRSVIRWNKYGMWLATKTKAIVNVSKSYVITEQNNYTMGFYHTAAIFV